MSWNEIAREAVEVAFYLLVEAPGGNLVEAGQVRIEHRSLAADEIDAAFGQRHRHSERLGDGRQFWFLEQVGFDARLLACKNLM